VDRCITSPIEGEEGRAQTRFATVEKYCLLLSSALLAVSRVVVIFPLEVLFIAF
jgi:hypothetical protein